MITKSFARSGVFGLFVAFLVAGCSSSDDSGGSGLLGGGTGIGGAPTVATLTLTGPTVVAPGVDTSGFIATLTAGTTTAIPAKTLSVSVTTGTASTYSAAGNEQVGTTTAKTDANGRITFNYQAPDTITKASSATITVTSADFIDSAGKPLTQTLVVSINPSTFKFTAPNPNTVIKVGAANAVALAFEWTNPTSDPTTGVTGTQGVAGSIDLTVSTTSGAVSSGSNATKAGPVIVVNGSAQNQSASPVANVMTSASNDGNFVVPVQVYDDNSGFATITATNHAAINQTVTLTLQFVDVPTSSNLVANPLAIAPSSTTQSVSNLTFTVENQANQPIAGVDVTFTLVSGAGGANERIYPLGGTTDQNGNVPFTYYAGGNTGMANIQACVNGTTVCSSQQITISSSAAPGTPTTTNAAIALAGPTNIGQNTTYDNFTAILTDGTGAPASGIFLNLSPVGGGNVIAPTGGKVNSGGAVTDANGEVKFSYLDNTASSTAATITINSSAVLNDGTHVSKTFNLVVNPDTFQFTSPAQPTAPATATTLKSGAGNAQPLTFSWMRLFETSSTSTTTSLEPFSGPISLSVGGSAQIVVPGVTAGANSVSVTTDNTGHFPAGVQIFDPVNETVTVQANDGDSFGYQTTLPLQFVAP